MSEDSGALYRRYRPRDLDALLGNESVVKSLRAIFKKKTMPHAYLFSGPSGCGKTTLARIIAKNLKCSDRDFHEYNAANVRGIATIREITTACKYNPLGGPVKVYLLDECHQLTGDAAEALLKLLEDTPDHVYLVLCTTEPETLLSTIRTRCTSYELNPLEKGMLYRLMKRVCASEEVKVDSDVLKLIAKRSDGSARKALVYLEQIMGIDDPDDAAQIIKDATASEVNAKNICKILLAGGNVRSKWTEMSPLLRAVTTDPESLRYAVLGYIGAVMLNKPSDRLAEMIMVFSDSWMYSKRAGMISAMYLACKL